MTKVPLASKVNMEVENPLHDAWFKQYYAEGHTLREHPAYLYSLWAWQARSVLAKEHGIEQDLQNATLNVADPVQYAAEEYRCAMKVLDGHSVPRTAGIETLSLVGRIEFLAGGKLS